VERQVPHLARRLVGSADELIEHSEILLVTRSGETLARRAAELGRSPLMVDLSTGAAGTPGFCSTTEAGAGPELLVRAGQWPGDDVGSRKVESVQAAV